jgi:hypothetical protein
MLSNPAQKETGLPVTELVSKSHAMESTMKQLSYCTVKLYRYITWMVFYSSSVWKRESEWLTG